MIYKICNEYQKQRAINKFPYYKFLTGKICKPPIFINTSKGQWCEYNHPSWQEEKYLIFSSFKEYSELL